MPKDKTVLENVREQLLEKKRRYGQWAGSAHGPVHTSLKMKVSTAFLDAALQRIDEGVYGTCCDCGEEIPAKRLETVPGAIRCRSCQEEVDKK